MRGACRLCGDDAKLLESHYIPRFVARWVKRTSITNFLRETNNPRKRVQDTAKDYLLCSSCETLLSVWETQFANQVFYPFVETGESVARYEGWMSKFCASVTWRTLVYIGIHRTRRDRAAEYYTALDDAEERLARFILGEIEDPGQYDQHLLPIAGIKSTSVDGLPPNINRYFLRAISMDIVGSTTDVFAYTKLPSFIILGCIRGDACKRMATSRLSTRTGTIAPREYELPKGFLSYFVEQCSLLSDAYQDIDSKDQDRIDRAVLNNLDRARDSKLLEAFEYDYYMFGDDAFF